MMVCCTVPALLLERGALVLLALLAPPLMPDWPDVDDDFLLFAAASAAAAAAALRSQDVCPTPYAHATQVKMFTVKYMQTGLLLIQ